MKTPLFLLISMMLGFTGISSAQLVFPNGPTLNLETSKQILYIETDIHFYTGSYTITDYTWERQTDDSVNLDWDLQACMNGDCKIGLPSSGYFITDFGINDTTGFIRFHVNSYGLSGSTRLRYLVQNKINFNDNAVLEFNITYTNSTGLDELNNQLSFAVYPNPTAENIQLSLPKDEWKTLKIVNTNGQLMPVDITETGLLNTGNYPEGIYFMSTSGHKRCSFVVQHP